MDSCIHVAPNRAAHSSTSGSCQVRRASMIPISSSACVVKPVMRLPLMMDVLVSGSRMPGKIAGPWHLFACYLIN